MNCQGTALLIVDPQNDFHEGGSLSVKGAGEDSERIAEMIMKNIDKLENIYITLDSHHRNHIAHAIFWQNSAGEMPTPFTLISHADVLSGKWFPADTSLLEHCKWYTHALEATNRFTLCIWPEHCLIGTIGGCVVPCVNKAVQEWCGRRRKSVRYILKGMNCLTEMYSAIAADVPILTDKSTCKDPIVMKEIVSNEYLLVCGQAKSHCVNYTLRDILVDWIAYRGTSAANKIYLLTDGTSSVPGFEHWGVQFETDMVAAGVNVATTGSVFGHMNSSGKQACDNNSRCIDDSTTRCDNVKTVLKCMNK